MKDLLRKFRDNTISREEFDLLVEIVNDSDSETGIKFWLGEFWGYGPSNGLSRQK